VILNSGSEAHDLLPGVHGVASLAKRWLLGTHQGGVKPGHLPAYLDEFTFRSTVVGRAHEGCCSIGCSRVPSPFMQRRIVARSCAAHTVAS
jgi:hypothetical protein